MKPATSSPTTSSTLLNESINLNEEASVNYWLAALECTELELRVAIAEVGQIAKDVGNELGKVV
jgi:hypothetical protein